MQRIHICASREVRGLVKLDSGLVPWLWTPGSFRSAVLRVLISQFLARFYFWSAVTASGGDAGNGHKISEPNIRTLPV